jgi:hypothetical protein
VYRKWYAKTSKVVHGWIKDATKNCQAQHMHSKMAKKLNVISTWIYKVEIMPTLELWAKMKLTNEWSEMKN